MRSTLLTVIVVASSYGALLWGAADWPNASASSAALEWVRTVDGWERSESLMSAPGDDPLLHPLTLAALQILLAGVALTVGWKGSASPLPSRKSEQEHGRRTDRELWRLKPASKRAFQPVGGTAND